VRASALRVRRIGADTGGVRILLAGLAVLALTGGVLGCGEEQSEVSRAPDAKRAAEQAYREDVEAQSQGKPASVRESLRCKEAVDFMDPEADTRSWISPEPAGRKPAPPSGDLRRLSVAADAHGVCVSFTTGAPMPPGSEISFVARGPFVGPPGGGKTAHAYGYIGAVREETVELSYGRARSGSGPHLVRGQTSRSGSTITIFVTRAELDRSPGNMLGRPPFPFRRFTFEAKVITPVGPGPTQEADFLPQERGESVGIVEGQRCPQPCRIDSLR